MTLLTEEVTTELLKKYDRPGPRYTSYPTAVEFTESFTAADYEKKARAGGGPPGGAPLDLRPPAVLPRALHLLAAAT